MVIMLCLIGMVGVIFVILCIFARANGKRIVREDEKEVTASVIRKKYESPYVTMISMNSCTVPQSHAARYLVTMSCEAEDVSVTYNDETLYKTVNEGDSIQMMLYKAYDKDDNLIGKPELRFPG